MIDIDRIFFINLDHRTDRWEKIEKEFIPLIPDQYQDKVERFSAIDHTEYDTVEKRAAGCAYSQLAIWDKCIKENLNTVLIFEDDVKWNIDRVGIYYYLNFLSSIDFDICNIGYRIENLMIPTEYDELIQTLEFVMACGYIVKVDFLKRIYSHVKNKADGMFYHGEDFRRNALDISWLKFLFNREDNTLNKKWFLTREKLVTQYINHSNIMNCIHDTETDILHR